jgi:putative membrane protein
VVALVSGLARCADGNGGRGGAGAHPRRDVAHTKNRMGVLIFVSLGERYTRIIADEGLAQKVQTADWQAAINVLTGHMRDGRIVEGFAAAIERCAAVLAAHAAPDGSANGLPDRLYVM